MHIGRIGTLLLTGVLSMPGLALAADRPVTGGGSAPSLEWFTCGIDIGCAELQVPLDHADPDARTISLPVARVLAADPAHRLGTIVYIHGGPGGPGTPEIYPGALTQPLHEAFDLVGWDPRGTSGESAITCIPHDFVFADLDTTPDTPAELTALTERARLITDDCLAAHGELMPYLGTYETVMDLEALRQALGEEQLTLWAVSYGTKVAAIYATLFPERVRAMLLDGYDDPNMPAEDWELLSSTAVERELQSVLGGCAADPGCARVADGDPGAAFDRLLAELDASPEVPGWPDGPHAQTMLLDIVGQYLYGGTETRAALLELLGAAFDGDLQPLTETYRAMVSGPSSGYRYGAYLATECADDAGELVGGEEAAASLRRSMEAAPRINGNSDPTLWEPIAAEPGMCALQPLAASRLPPGIDAAGAGPALIITTTGDPATPIESAYSALRDLEDAQLLVVDVPGHLGFDGARWQPAEPRSKCVIDTVHRFLLEGVVPREEVRCSSHPEAATP